MFVYGWDAIAPSSRYIVYTGQGWIDISSCVRPRGRCGSCEQYSMSHIIPIPCRLCRAIGQTIPAYLVQDGRSPWQDGGIGLYEVIGTSVSRRCHRCRFPRKTRYMISIAAMLRDTRLGRSLVAFVGWQEGEFCMYIFHSSMLRVARRISNDSWVGRIGIHSEHNRLLVTSRIP